MKKDVKVKYCFYIHHLLKEDLFYVGVTKCPELRFQNSGYIRCALYQYLDFSTTLKLNPNIETVCTEPLYTYDEAKFIEDWFITAFKPGKCINKNRSGMISQDLISYHHNWDKNHPEKRKKIYTRANKKRLTLKEWKVYSRVRDFNRHHPDRAIETPLEVKEKYLEWGYIPDYIKSDDLTAS